MYEKKRLDEILAIIKRKKRITNDELCQKLFCSLSTLRRDLLQLEKEGALKRIRGGAILTSYSTAEPAQAIRETEQILQKRQIAQTARDFIGPGMCLYLDSSTTAYELCPLLAAIEHLILFTNGLKTALYLSENCQPTTKVFINGGEVKHQASSVLDVHAGTALIDHFSVDIAFCSARGIDENGVYEASLGQALSKKQLTRSAKQTILLIDSAKFASKQFFKIGELADYQTIISEKKPPAVMLQAAESAKVEWLYDES